MKKIIVYFPYPLKPGKSGSAVRPRKILEAFKEYGELNNIEIISIHGESKERKQKLIKLYRDANPREILFCYMENSTLPFWLTDSNHIPRTPLMEYNLFQFLKKGNIPLGLFYRDVYWKFDDEYPLRGIKRMIMRFIYRRELSLYKKYVDHFFLPSIEMNRYINFPVRNTSSLPPGGNEIVNKFITNLKREESSLLSLIYVGGISKRYGLEEMLKAVSLSFHNGVNIELHLVCREEEYQKNKFFFTKYKGCSWLKIYHAYGNQLEQIYSKANAGIIPRQKSVYNDFAVPVKLFEYISHGLPIISTNCSAQAKIVNEDNLGVVVKDDVDGLVKGIEYLANTQKRKFHSRDVKDTLLNKHLWIHRIEKISDILNRCNI